MNEQLLKIAKQAGLTLSVDQQIAFRRAAELLVKECANISNQAEKQCQHPGTEIKKHFGVEE
jgi:hypothetical protein